VKIRVLTVAAVALLCLAPAASAKFKMSLALGDSTPKVGQPITVVLRADVDLDYDLKLIAPLRARLLLHPLRHPLDERAAELPTEPARDSAGSGLTEH